LGSKAKYLEADAVGLHRSNVAFDEKTKQAMQVLVTVIINWRATPLSSQARTLHHSGLAHPGGAHLIEQPEFGGGSCDGDRSGGKIGQRD